MRPFHFSCLFHRANKANLMSPVISPFEDPLCETGSYYDKIGEKIQQKCKDIDKDYDVVYGSAC